MKCPCSSTKEYKKCCEIAHKNIMLVKTAEQLMRSRYSAFVFANVNYLHKSHHSSTRPSKKEKREIEKWTKSVNWVKLEVIQTSKGTAYDIDGTVEFKAFFMENGQLEVIHENSAFCKENGHWVYIGVSK